MNELMKRRILLSTGLAVAFASQVDSSELSLSPKVTPDMKRYLANAGVVPSWNREERLRQKAQIRRQMKKPARGSGRP